MLDWKYCRYTWDLTRWNSWLEMNLRIYSIQKKQILKMGFKKTGISVKTTNLFMKPKTWMWKHMVKTEIWGQAKSQQQQQQRQNNVFWQYSRRYLDRGNMRVFYAKDHIVSTPLFSSELDITGQEKGTLINGNEKYIRRAQPSLWIVHCNCKMNTRLAQSWSLTPQMANYSKCRENDTFYFFSFFFLFFFLVYLEEEESKQDGQWWNHLI